MAPIKFDENIKSKLEERSLQPSSEAWKKLSERLDTQTSSNKKTPNYWWIGMAASAIGIIFVLSQFGDSSPTGTIEPEVVVTPKTVTQDVDNVVAKESIEAIAEEIPEPDQAAQTKNIEGKKSIHKKMDEVMTTSHIVVAETVNLPSKAPTLAINEKENADISKSFEEQKIQDIVAHIEDLKANGNEVGNDEIDALLLAAQQEITLNQLINKNAGIVDADLLLQDVEAEVDQSFRSKVFEALKQSYNSVKTAVAQRND